MAASAEAVEAVSEILSRVGHGGVAVEEPLAPGGPHVVKAYVPGDEAAPVRIGAVTEAVGRLAAFGLAALGEVEVHEVREEDWLTAWRAHYRPMVVGRFLIRPSWIEEPAAGRLVVELDPGMAFGTGLHPTTQQMLLALSELELSGRDVLDVGTGSAILALAARAAGARRVVAVDSDPVAVRVARENVGRAGGGIEVLRGSAADVAGRFDVVLANIVARVIAEMAPALAERLAPTGVLVVAGLIADGAEVARLALERAGLRVAGRQVRDGWVSLILRHH